MSTTICFILSLSTSAYSQIRGCTDSQAINYNATATENDGSCTYDQTIKRPSAVCELPTTLNETSGLAFFNNKTYSMNDGGNQARLHEIVDVNCALEAQPLQAAWGNTDWEDLASSETHVYIGDFGNNFGQRRNLKIYIADEQLEPAGQIDFEYEDQDRFNWPNGDHPYDCEAFFYHNDSLHLFTKDRLFEKTRHYVVPARAGTHVAILKDSLDVRGLITSADISAEGIIQLLGYRISGEVFSMLLFDYKKGQYFSGNKREILLGPAFEIGQAEAAVFTEGHFTLFTNENNFGLPARVLEVDFSEFVEHTTQSNDIEDTQPTVWIINENIVVTLPKSVGGDWIIVDAQGRLWKSGSAINGKQLNIKAPDLPTGAYWIMFKESKKVVRWVHSE